MDPEAIENTLSREAQTAAGPESVAHDEKTDELVTSLETGVDKAYSTIQDSTLSGFTKISGIVAERLPELQKQWKDVKLPQLSNVNVNVNELTKNLKFDEYVKKEDLDLLKQRGGELMSKAGENTTKVLDDLDSDLEKIENLTINYAQQLGGQIGTFFKSQVGQGAASPAADEGAKQVSAGAWNWSGWGKQLTGLIAGDSPEAVLSQEKKTELLFSLPKGISAGTRAESQVHELQSDSSIYLKAVESGEFEDYKVSDEQHAEAKELLSNDSLHLMAVYKKICDAKESEAKPLAKEESDKDEKMDTDKDADKGTNKVEQKKISDADFWKVYFGKKDQIMQDEKKRRELLEKSTTVGEDDDEEDFNWDDE